eukprot:scaffold537_cov180-Ochromonas_danica.AAC.56
MQRPGSGQRPLASSQGLPPGTGMRPGSGRRPPGTARLRTGVAPSGPGTQAAQGLALSANVNVSDRPVTGHGMMGMKVQGQGQGRLVQDAAYYIGILRKKINDVNNESIKLRNEIDQQSRDNAQYVQLERRYETLLKSKEALEGQLADYNLALDKIRSATDPEDVQQMALHMSEKNRQAGQELDRIFMARKQREQETAQLEEQIENIQGAIQKRINDLDPNRLRAYNELLMRQKDLQDRLMQSEARLNAVNNQVRAYESDDKSSSIRKEFVSLEKAFQSLHKDADSLQEELDIANMDPKEAHTRFVSRINNFKQGAKGMEEKASQLREEIAGLRRHLDDLATSAMAGEQGSAEDAEKYELLVKRDQEMTAFIDAFEETSANIIREQKEAQFMVVALLEHIGKGLEDSHNMPSQEMRGEMESAKQFKEKNLVTAQKTMESLAAEKKKREKELEMLRSSEPKLRNELTSLRDGMQRMRLEMEDLQDLDRIRRDFDETKSRLLKLKADYTKRRETMRQQIQSISIEHESLKKALQGNEIARDLEDTEKRLKHYERGIFELKEFVDSKSRETDYEQVKGLCLKLVDQINVVNIRAAQLPSPGQQAKGW